MTDDMIPEDITDDVRAILDWAAADAYPSGIRIRCDRIRARLPEPKKSWLDAYCTGTNLHRGMAGALVKELCTDETLIAAVAKREWVGSDTPTKRYVESVRRAFAALLAEVTGQ